MSGQTRSPLSFAGSGQARSRVGWAKARCSIARVGKIVHAPCPRGDGTANDFAHPTADYVKAVSCKLSSRSRSRAVAS